MILLRTPESKDTANFALQMMVALALNGGLFLVVLLVAWGKLKADSAVVGSVFTMYIILVNFCFPNSIGAQKQQDTISALTEKVAPMTGEALVSQQATEASHEQSRADASKESVGGSDGAAGEGAAGASAEPIAARGDSPEPTFPDEPPSINGLGEEAEPGGEKIPVPDGGGFSDR